MKKCIKKIAVCLLAVMLFSVLAGYAYAANDKAISFSTYLTIGSYSSVSTIPWKKYNASPLYVRIDDTAPTSTYYARALACGETIADTTNYTLYNAQLVDHVTIERGVRYSIYSMIYEKGRGVATLSLMTYGAYGTVTGEWSPDSAQTFNAPSL